MGTNEISARELNEEELRYCFDELLLHLRLKLMFTRDYYSEYVSIEEIDDKPKD